MGGRDLLDIAETKHSKEIGWLVDIAGTRETRSQVSRVARSLGWHQKCVDKKVLKRKCKMLMFKGKWVNWCYVKHRKRMCFALDKRR